MRQFITVLRKHAARALFLILTLPFLLSMSNLSYASTADPGIASSVTLFQTESPEGTTEEGKEEEEEPDC